MEKPIIGHLKSDCIMNPNRLKGLEGVQITAVLVAVAMNVKKLLAMSALFGCGLHINQRFLGRSA